MSTNGYRFMTCQNWCAFFVFFTPHADGNRKIILDNHGNDVLLRSMKKHSYSADAQLYACWALVEIAAEDARLFL
jgi:hypothetical protein